MVATWRERGGRGLAHVAMQDFPTVADALFEIVDNPFDYRRGRHLNITIEIAKDHDSIVVEDRGGEGMDDEGIDDWLGWGLGHKHKASDIGQFHKGGKAACGYLADGVIILARRARNPNVWRFEDPDWKSHEEWADYGSPTPYLGPIPPHLAAVSSDAGYTRFELSGLTDRRYNLDRLRWMIGNTYRRLINEGAVTFTLNGERVTPLDLPLSPAFATQQHTVKLPSGRRVRVWVGRLDRDAVRSGPHRIYGGMRLLYQGRLISDAEWFGHHAEGKGSLASLIGEVEMNHVPVLSNKTGFQRGTPEWEEVDAAMHDYLAPIIAEFRRATEEHPVPREERKRVNDVRRQLAQALQNLRTAPGEGGDREQTDAGPGGRRPPHEATTATSPTSSHRKRHKRRPRTEAPDDAVGTLQRLRRRLLKGDNVPPIDLDSLDPSIRSEATRDGDQVMRIVINREYQMYRDLNAHASYMAETALLDLLMPAEAEKIPVKDYVEQVNQCLEAWYRVTAQGGDAPAA